MYPFSLRGLLLVDYLTFFTKINFCDFLFALLHIKPLLKRGLKRRDFAPRGSKFFPFRVTPFHKGVAGLGGSVGCASDWYQEVVGSTPAGWQHSSLEIDHEIVSTIILSLPLIQEGSCLFLAKERAQYWLTA